MQRARPPARNPQKSPGVQGLFAGRAREQIFVSFVISVRHWAKGSGRDAWPDMIETSVGRVDGGVFGLGRAPHVLGHFPHLAALNIAEEIIHPSIFARKNNGLWNSVFGMQLASISMRGGIPSMVSSANCFLIETSYARPSRK